ncbi:MAG: isoprenyl transferase [Planctomycetia bacterium]|nr:isoprenyl transferase [Planctomycetia bacterium]
MHAPNPQPLTPNPFVSEAPSASDTFDVPLERRPRHIAIIMDGNGRWAQRRGLPRIEGHRHGVASVRHATEEAARLKVGQLTLYCLSSENWKRPQAELDFLMHLLEQYLVEERTTLLDENIRLAVIGSREGIPASVMREMEKTIHLTSGNTGMTLCLAVNYGSRAEIAEAARRIADDVHAGRIAPELVTEELIASRLYTAGMTDPDLVIRTAGELRISNFLLWQISYAELWVTEQCWPEFAEADLQAAIRDFAARDRRYGGLNE